jgi:DNA repair protein RadC
LSDAELIAIFLRTGVKGKNAVELARELVTHFGSLRGLMHASFEEFSHFTGIGKVKYVQFQALTELCQRYLQEKLAENIVLSHHEDTKNFLMAKLRDLKQEVFVCLFLNTQNELIAYEELFRGTLNHSNVYPREIVKRVLYHHASAVILAHNHPSGKCEPSDDDIIITNHIKKALFLIDTQVYDHLIIGNSEVFSLAEKGYLNTF